MPTLTKRALIATAALIPIVVSSGAAEAHQSHQKLTIAWEVSTSVSNYTDCPVTAPAEIDCVGTQVFVEQREKRIGRTRISTSTASVSIFVVHFHADGTFELDELPFATGSGPVSLRFHGISRLRVTGSVPMSDGTAVGIGVRLSGVGPVNRYADTGSGPDPDCPSGSSEGTWSGAWRDAEASGVITVDGAPLVPTSAVGVPFILDEHGRGSCLP
jgi:hypothetical protein